MSNKDEEVIITEDEETETQETHEPTKTEQFIERLRQYPDRETAKSHITEIAKDLECAKSLGYKALKRIDEFKPAEERALETEEARITFEEPPREEIEEEPVEEEVIEEEIIEEPIVEERAPPTFPMTLEKLEFNISLAFKKIADLTKYPEFALDKKESQGIAEAWYPVLEQYAPQALGNPAVWAIVTTGIVIVPRVVGYASMRAKKKEEELPKPPTPKPKEPQEETPKETQETPLETPKEEPPKKKPETASFMKKL